MDAACSGNKDEQCDTNGQREDCVDNANDEEAGEEGFR